MYCFKFAKHGEVGDEPRHFPLFPDLEIPSVPTMGEKPEGRTRKRRSRKKAQDTSEMVQLTLFDCPGKRAEPDDK